MQTENRYEWKFAYSADKLTEAARKKAAHHHTRLEWWTEKQKQVMEKIKAEGLEIDESLVAEYATRFSNLGRGPTVQVREDLLRDLHECVSKTASHRNKERDYEAWVEILSSQGSTTFELNQADWLFFFSEKPAMR